MLNRLRVQVGATRLQFRRYQYRRLYERYRNFTMLSPLAFVTNLEAAYRNVPNTGCIVECGVWRGGMSAAIADVLPGRLHYLFDSLEGLPQADPERDGAAAVAFQRDKTSPWYHDNNRAERGFADRAMAMSRAGRYELVPGWFKNTLPSFTPAESIALLRLDGDWYASTMECLAALYPHVMPGGLILIDDYYDWDGCARAVHDFLGGTEPAARVRSMGRFGEPLAFILKPH